MLALRAAGKTQRVIAKQIDRTEMAINARMSVVSAQRRSSNEKPGKKPG